MKMMSGGVLLNGRLTLAQSGKSTGRILSLVRSWLLARLTGLLQFGKK